MSKLNNDFEVGDTVFVVWRKNYFWMDIRDFTNKTFTITNIVIKDREIQYEIQNQPGCSYRVTSDLLSHADNTKEDS